MADFPPLADDETLLWEGRPDTKLRFGLETLATGIFAGALILACLGIATVLNRAEPGLFWPIFAPGVGIACVIVLAYPLIDSAARRKTAYRLTSKRAFIRGPLGGPETDATHAGYPIPPLDELIYRNGTPPTIYFGKRALPSPKGARPKYKSIGFERIADAKHVFIQMREIATEQHG